MKALDTENELFSQKALSKKNELCNARVLYRLNEKLAKKIALDRKNEIMLKESNMLNE